MSGKYEILEPVITIQEGTLKGTFGTNLDEEYFVQFLGIPYAKPPIGDLRFKPPQPIDPWQNIRDATKVGSASISRDDLTREIVGSEDCLYLNVYTKKLPTLQSKSKPVMVFIHGGGFVCGSNRTGLYGPEFLMIKDIVLVTLNYRLGILGFLAVDHPAFGIHGNMGLKDQNLALKWVQRNISYFNGDPNNVTIFGQSAGSWSVHSHILSPASNGLFHKAILQSGVALNSRFWGSKNNAREIVKQLGKKAKTENKALEILQSVSGLDILNAKEKMFESPCPAYRRPFAAVIETPNDTEFITKSPIQILKEGNYNKVPIMMGYTETEGMMFVGSKGAFKLPDFQLKDFIPCELNVANKNRDVREICDILNTVYKPDENHYDEMTDGYFLVGIIETLRNQLKTAKTPIYLYRMSLAGQLNYFKKYLNKLGEPGVCHCDDLGYLFHSDLTPEIKPGSVEDKYVRTFVELWTNFAEYGNPTPNDKLDVLWEPVKNEENIKLLDIGKELKFKEIPERHRVTAWLNILKKWPLTKFE